MPLVWRSRPAAIVQVHGDVTGTYPLCAGLYRFEPEVGRPLCESLQQRLIPGMNGEPFLMPDPEQDASHAVTDARVPIEAERQREQTLNIRQVRPVKDVPGRVSEEKRLAKGPAIRVEELPIVSASGLSPRPVIQNSPGSELLWRYIKYWHSAIFTVDLPGTR